MQEPYIAPQLTLAGEASEIILGMGHAGGDFFGEYIYPNGGGFENDATEETPFRS